MIPFFDANIATKLGARATTMRAVIREMQARGLSNIVETGCARQADNWAGDGQSTFIWAEFITQNGSGSLTSFDVDSDALKYAASLTAGKKNCYFMEVDGVKGLSLHSGYIDCLYLDSLDVDMANQHPAALHAFMEFTAAQRMLKKNSIVFVDDAPIEYDGRITGKGLYIAEYFKSLGVYPFATGYQAAWLMP